ncbi:hypothetical protein [Streptomyces sp. NPDC047000]|uniref:hypothetical protein n=1 Tax=Streptomyces sp. NPDC047000 TaxID=3155474 RepID=UPI0033F229B3
MSTVMIIVLIVCVVAVLAVAAIMMSKARRPRGGRSLKRRFGPEYERTVARHDGNTQAAERELAARVERHGDLRERPLDPQRRERYEARWTAAQERFVDSPREAVAEADRIIADVADERGFPGDGRYEEQVDALSVHHAEHVHGYRRVHRVANPDGTATGTGSTTGGGTATEEMRESLLEARALFDELVGTSADTRRGPAHRRQGGHGHGDTTFGDGREGQDAHGPARHRKWHKEERTA